jgi:lysophospholipase L1-like esterase
MRLLFRLALLLSFAAAALAQTAPPVPLSPSDAGKLVAKLNRDEKILRDWPNLGRYAQANLDLAPPKPGEGRVVFLGDSITDNWGRRYGKFFPGKPFVNRGIGGQTTPQMLVRFRADVIALHPAAVVILAGTNDIAGNTGPATLEQIEDNFESMSELARLHHIRVVLSSVTPVCDYIKPQTQRRPPDAIIRLNRWIKDYAGRTGATYLDYYTALLDNQGFLRRDMTVDGLHPNDAGYAVMEPLALQAIARALARP